MRERGMKPSTKGERGMKPSTKERESNETIN